MSSLMKKYILKDRQGMRTPAPGLYEYLTRVLLYMLSSKSNMSL